MNSTSAIEPQKILMVRIAWMKYYEGRVNIDIPRSGAKYIKTNKNGGELNNFKNYKGKYYAYIPLFGSINIQNLGANINDEFIKGILVVFCATHPVEKGMRIVGWYKNATVYKYAQSNSFSEYYFIESDAKNVTRIDADNRFCNIPDTFGRSASFFFSLHPEKNSTFKKVKSYIQSGGKVDSIRPKKNTSKASLARQVNVEKRIKVEQSAIRLALNYYSERYGRDNVKSVEKDNVGWDLEVNIGSVNLKIEVKGLSGSKMLVELTPNEYKALIEKRQTYFLFIVTNALNKNPDFEIFSYFNRRNELVGHKKTIVKVSKVVGARISI